MHKEGLLAPSAGRCTGPTCVLRADKSVPRSFSITRTKLWSNASKSGEQTTPHHRGREQ